MFKINKKIEENFNKIDIKKAIINLKDNEYEIYFFKKITNFEQLKTTINKKRLNIENLKNYLNKLYEYLKSEKEKENSNRLDKIISYLINILKILKTQIENLSQLEQELIFLNNATKNIIIEDKVKDKNNQKLNSMLFEKKNEILKSLEEQSKIIMKYSIELEKLININEEINKSRFIIKEDVIIDTKTNLIWDRNFQNIAQMNWNQAINNAKKKGKQLPTRNDFKTLSENEKCPKLEELENIGFKNINHYYFWTSDEVSKDYAFSVNFILGDFNISNKSYNLYTIFLRKN